MNKKISNLKRASVQNASRRNLAKMLAAAGLMLGAGVFQSCQKDILTGQPEWLGNSIYERLQEGFASTDQTPHTFNTTLNLINDLGYTETLSRTGSKTLFVTPDDVYDQWLQSKGLTYKSLTQTQKKQLFHSSMINNAYLLNLMSNVSGNPPEEAACLRRETASSLLDSVPRLNVADMPVNPLGDPEKDAWKKVREGEKQTIYICEDQTSAPMMHFLPDFMEKNSITAEDLAILSNGVSQSINDAWISGQKVISDQQTCKNGYVYMVNGVIEGSQNMAQAIRNEPTTQLWAKALARYSCPVEVTGNTLWNFQQAYNTQDKLYEMRYFTGYQKSGVRNSFLQGPLEKAINALGTLRFDPGWNQYEVQTSTLRMAHDAAVMIVPTDAALREWFENEGRDLIERFGSWENINYETLASLINVNMLESFVSSVPSKFESVLDYTSQRALGIKKEDIEKCIMCCNGVVYVVNKVFAPDAFSSVIYPAQIQSEGTYGVAGHALTGFYDESYSAVYDFSPYLSSMESTFALVIPFNTTESTLSQAAGKGKMFRIVDPCSYGLKTPRIIEFFYTGGKIMGYSYEVDEVVEGAQPRGIVTEIDPSKNKVLQNRMNDLIDNNIIVLSDGSLSDDQEYYKTKTGGVLKVYRQNGELYVDGGYQIEKNEPLLFPDSCIVKKDNGYTLGAGSQTAMQGKFVAVPMSATKSVYQTLKEHTADTLFYSLLASSELLSAKEGSNEPAGNDNLNVNVFDSYNYTVYVPEDSKIRELIDKGYLPTWADYEALAEAAEGGDQKAIEQREVIKNRINDFLRYHIQDNSVFINGGYVSQAYETAKLNPKTNRFYTLNVTADKTNLTVTDNSGNTRNVVKNGDFYNKIVREYWISGRGKATAMLESSSHAVVHKIDGVLIFDASQLTPWKK
ncbi:MAG: fasciclin domain-containing protein [Bacteroidaceae bacterium]|nr:fasciclin domain-containing protein [Bacteroidaceae bacterium]